MKIAISTGLSFGLSDAAIRLLAKKKGITLYPEIRRTGWRDSTIYWTVPKDKWMCEPADLVTAPQKEVDAYFEYLQDTSFSDEDWPRDDRDLIEVIEELGSVAASAKHAKLHIVEIPDGVDWVIECDDEFGNEWVAERHRTWHYDRTDSEKNVPNDIVEQPEYIK